MTFSPAQELQSLLVAAAASARAERPLRLLVRRRAPLVSQGELRGHLDALLRLSCHGDGHGEGVLVFDWPAAAHGHSVVRLLDRRRGGDGALRVESREVVDGADVDVHLKVFFDAASITDELLELFDLVGRMGILEPVREEVGRYPTAARAPVSGPAATRNGSHVPTPKPPAAAEPVRHPVSLAEQEKIDRVVNHAAFDASQHPHVAPNGEVINSAGEVFRLVMRRSDSGMHRQWLRIGKETANPLPGGRAETHFTASTPATAMRNRPGSTAPHDM